MSESPFSPQTVMRAARILIPIALVIGIVSAIIGNWPIVAAMALLAAAQAMNLRGVRRRLHDDTGDGPFA